MPNAPRVAVLSHGVWMDRFGGDPRIVGRMLRLDNQPHTVVGVMPRGLDFPRGADLWIPVVPVLVASSATWGTNALETVGVLYAVGRLKPGITVPVARDEMERLGRPTWRGTEASRTIVATPFLDHLLGPVRRGLWWLLGAVVVLLLVACGNVSGLALTRAVARRRDTAIRLALGAHRAGIARDAVIESMTLAAIDHGRHDGTHRGGAGRRAQA